MEPTNTSPQCATSSPPRLGPTPSDSMLSSCDAGHTHASSSVPPPASRCCTLALVFFLFHNASLSSSRSTWRPAQSHGQPINNPPPRHHNRALHSAIKSHDLPCPEQATTPPSSVFFCTLASSNDHSFPIKKFAALRWSSSQHSADFNNGPEGTISSTSPPNRPARENRFTCEMFQNFICIPEHSWY